MELNKLRRRHPATFSEPILRVINKLLSQHGGGLDIPLRLLDPFVGVGGVAGVDWDGEKYGVELEAEWAEQATEKGIVTHVGDSRNLPWAAGYFGIICTSPAYGNRLADGYAPDLTDPKHKKRRSYRIDLGRRLSPGNGGSMHWGDEYRTLHAQVWKECVRVLCPGGLLVLNVKDHYRKGVLEEVGRWHLETLLDLGMEVVAEEKVPLRGDQNTATMRARGVRVVDCETVTVLRKEVEEE